MVAAGALPVPLEHDEQVAVCQWLDRRRVPFFAVPNSAKRSPRLAAYMKAEGLRAGVPDLWLPMHRVVIEMKRRNASPSDTTPEQHAWLASLRAAGGQAG